MVSGVSFDSRKVDISAQPTLLRAQKKKRSRAVALSAFSALPLVLTRSRLSGIEPPSAPMMVIEMVNAGSGGW